MIDKIVGFHIEPTNICTLKCPGCARTQFINQWPQHWKNYNLDIDQTLSFIDIDITNKTIVLCGDYGDPIYHPEFIKFVKKFKQRGANLVIFTNGSYKTKEWWQELTILLTEQDQITFSIDGTPDNFTEYRINANWDSIKIGIEIAVNSKAAIHWKYIPFLYNQNHIEIAKNLSVTLGVDKFYTEFSDRFDKTTDYLKPDLDMLGDRYISQTNWKNNQTGGVKPKCRNNHEHYISAAGFYSPCCQIADHRFYYKHQFGKNKHEYNIANHTLSQILTAPKTIEFFQTLKDQAPCQFNCPG